MLERFPESDSRVDPDTREFVSIKSFFLIEKGLDFLNGVIVCRFVLHVLRGTLGMHENETSLIALGQVEQLWVSARYVVD